MLSPPPLARSVPPFAVPCSAACSSSSTLPPFLGRSSRSLGVHAPTRANDAVQASSRSPSGHSPTPHIISSTAVKKLSSGLYRVSCLSKVSYKLLFSRGNIVGKDNPVPAISKSEFTVICDFPSEITLIANENENRLGILEAARKADRGPDRLQASSIEWSASPIAWERSLVLQNSTDVIQLQIVSSLRVTPEYVLLVFHPEAQVNFCSLLVYPVHGLK
uniref:NUP210 Ig-like domain-containing protein n=1 Tax=Zea mays TaxID=4577 RepID=A0A804LPV9_MAIZE